MTDTKLVGSDLDFLCDFVRDRSGISLDESKAYLFNTRLGPILAINELETLEDLVSKLRINPAQNGLADQVVDALTTNETSFFRDLHPFQALKSYVIPKLIERCANDRTLNIWCGASSSGQEPYTIAMTLLDGFPQLKTWTINFIATDISESMLTRCREGLYSQLEINRGLPATMLLKYFEEDGRNWRISEELRSMIDFRQLNLIKPWPLMPRLDIVFLRNVLIYFELDVRQSIVGNIVDQLKPDGYVFLGSTESALTIDPRLKGIPAERSSCYSLTGE